jgi:hypothetical protein
MRDRVQTFKNDKDRAQLMYVHGCESRRHYDGGGIDAPPAVCIHRDTSQGRGTRAFGRG